jgi:hypothetical protein
MLAIIFKRCIYSSNKKENGDPNEANSAFIRISIFRFTSDSNNAFIFGHKMEYSLWCFPFFGMDFFPYFGKKI